MKEKLFTLLNRYLILVLSFLPAVFLLRLQEFLYLEFLHDVPAHTWIFELTGYLHDNFIFLTFSLVLLVPFAAVSLLSRRGGSIAAFVLLTGYFLVGFALVKYFTITLVPLDQVIFSYTTREMIQIVLSSTRFDPWALAAFAAIAGVPFILYRFLRKKAFPGYPVQLFLIVLAVSPAAAAQTLPDQSRYENDFGYFIASNKVFYALSRITASRFVGPAVQTDAKIRAASQRFHSGNKEFEYIDPDYPFLRVDNSKDVLGDFFNFNAEKPNLVFIVVESLSTSFSGPSAFYGSFMPFLDSISSQGLYWGNFLSTSERTFNVFSAIFGSLPYCEGVFYSTGSKNPYHFSMIRYLREQGYHPYFFYAGDPRYSGYENFMRNESIE